MASSGVELNYESPKKSPAPSSVSDNTDLSNSQSGSTSESKNFSEKKSAVYYDATSENSDNQHDLLDERLSISDLHSFASLGRHKFRGAPSNQGYKIVKLAAEIQLLREELNRMGYTDVKQLQENLRAAHAETAALRQRNDEYRDKISILEENARLTNLSIASLANQSSTSQASSSGSASKRRQPTAPSREIELLRTEIENYRHRIETLEEMLIAPCSKCLDTNNRNTTIPDDIIVNENAMNTMAVRDSSFSRHASDSQLESLRKDIAIKNKTIRELSGEVKRLSDQIEDNESKLRKLTQQLVEKDKDFDELSVEFSRLKQIRLDAGEASDRILVTKSTVKARTISVRSWLATITMLTLFANAIWASRRLLFALMRIVVRKVNSAFQSPKLIN